MRPRQFSSRRILGKLLLILVLVGARAALAQSGDPVRILTPSATVDHRPVREISGIVQSQRCPGVYWIHNDSGNAPNLFAIRADGQVIVPEPMASLGYRTGSQAGDKLLYLGIPVEGARNVDWESLSLDGGLLYLCDLGNNDNARRNLGVYVLQEPDPRSDGAVRVLKRLAVAYPDQAGFPPAGPWEFDCEASFVYRHKLYFLTKHRSAPLHLPAGSTRLYRLDTESPEKTNLLTLVEQRSDLGGWVTDACLSPDGRTLAVLCQAPRQSVWLFESRQDDRFLAGSARRLEFQRGGQCEAITFVDRDHLLVTNEQGQIFRLDIADFEPAP